jgi:hypothetical protein
MYVLFCVLFLCKCVQYYCHWVSTQLQSNIISYHICVTRDKANCRHFVALFENKLIFRWGKTWCVTLTLGMASEIPCNSIQGLYSLLLKH